MVSRDSTHYDYEHQNLKHIVNTRVMYTTNEFIYKKDHIKTALQKRCDYILNTGQLHFTGPK